PVRDPVENITAGEEPFLRAFIGAKGVQAHERGVQLRVGLETARAGQLVEAQDVTAILGNLVDNAVAAVIDGAPAEPDERWVEV
ncbi:histidine kinase, partial [Mycobacterium tuberculosis]|nr:histidine kinase [Mycobacterium tuberculosis]